MSSDFFAGFITGGVIFLALGVWLSDHLLNLADSVIAKIPTRDELFGEDGILERYRKPLIIIAVVAVLATGIFAYVKYTKPKKVIAVGSVVLLADACDNMLNVTITQTHLDQGKILVGEGECELSYRYSAQKPGGN